jgi:hypothetical protein
VFFKDYLEVGVYQGLTLLSAASSASEASFFGIDNFAFFDKEGLNESLINDRILSLNLSNVNLINSDYEDALEKLEQYIGNKKVGVYFVDGPHDYRSQLKCLLLIKPYLADNAVIIVDDSNYRHVRLANRDFLLDNPEFKLVYQSYTKAHPNNLSNHDLKDVRKGWWNGVNIICKDVDNNFSTIFPPTFRDRGLYENEHNLHTVRYPYLLVTLSRILQKIKIPYLLTFLKPQKDHFFGKYNFANTYSEELEENSFNPIFKK